MSERVGHTKPSLLLIATVKKYMTHRRSQFIKQAIQTQIQLGRQHAAVAQRFRQWSCTIKSNKAERAAWQSLLNHQATLITLRVKFFLYNLIHLDVCSQRITSQIQETEQESEDATVKVFS